MNDKIVVTGLGVLSPNGKTVDEFWNNLIEGISGVDYIRAFDTSNYDIKIGAEVKDFDATQYLKPGIYRKIDRFAQLGVCCAKMALEDAGYNLPLTENTDRIGVSIGTGLGGIQFHEEQIIEVLQLRGPSKIMTSSVPRISPNSVSSYIAIAFQAKGPNYAISTACSSGANAIGQGLLLLRSGLVDVCVVGGVEAPLTPVTFAAYQALGCLSSRNYEPQKASRPFDKNRDGFVMGEGSGVLILETLTHAQKRKAKIYAELAGYGSNCGAYNMVAPQPEGEDAAAAMRMALGDAHLNINDVDYINAHGTSTVYNDLAETKAIKKVFGDTAKKILISATKSMIGHTIGAAGALGAIASILSLRNAQIHPTINLDEPDSECDLNYVPHTAIKKVIDVAMVNSFGFGSNNAVLIFKKSGQ